MNADDLARLLDELGRRLGPTGEHVFALAVRQVYIDGLMNLGAAVLGLGIIIGSAAVTRWKYVHDRNAYATKERDFYSSRPTPDFYILFGGLGVALGLLLVVGGLAGAVPMLLNPEYAALRGIIGGIR